MTKQEIEIIQNKVRKIASQGSRHCHPDRVKDVMTSGWDSIEIGTITWQNENGQKTYAKADENAVVNQDGVKMEMNNKQKRNMVASYAMICGLA